MGRVRAAHDGCRRLLSSACLALAAQVLGAQPAEEPVVFTADVQLVTLPVTVKDARGAPMADLGAEDFRILEQGEPREIAVFERRTNRPLSVALMLDASLSTAIELRYERKSAARFLARLLGSGSQPSDRAAVYEFSSGVAELAPFTSDERRLKKALEAVRPESGTSLYAAVLLASEELARREGRRVIVLITDGGDTTSDVRFADALRAVHAAEAAAYPLIVLPIRSDAGRNRGGEHALILLAERSGGEAFVQHGTENLDAAFDDVLRSLRTQYLLGFYPQGGGKAAADTFREVEVQVAREGATVLARSGYYAAEPPPAPVRRWSIQEQPVQVRRLPRRGDNNAAGVQVPEEETATEPIGRKPRHPPGAPGRPPIVQPPG